MVSLEQLSTFSGFKKDEDYKDPVVRQHFCLNAKEWIDQALKFCETQLKWGKRATLMVFQESYKMKQIPGFKKHLAMMKNSKLKI